MRIITSILLFMVIVLFPLKIINAQQAKDISKLYFQIQDGYVLDSVKFKETMNSNLFTTYHFQYDEEGKMIRNDCGYSIFRKLIGGKWVNLKVPLYYNYYYNMNSQVDHVDLEYFDSVWVSSSKYIYSYDADGRLISKIYGNKIDGTDSIVSLRKEIYEYNSDGNLIYYLNSMYSGSQAEWSKYEYDSLKRLKVRKDYSGVDSINYAECYKLTYDYDSLGNIWYNIMDVTKGSEIYKKRHYLEFNESGKLIGDRYWNYYPNHDSLWLGGYKVMHEYDGEGKLQSISRGEFSFNKWEWNNLTKYVAYTYNSEGNLASLNNGYSVEWRGGWVDFISSESLVLNDSFGNSIPLDCWKAEFYYSKPITGVEQNSSTVKDFQLYQNYPNPFNPETTISYLVPVGTRRGVFVQLCIYDVLGKEVAALVNEEKAPGYYEISFDAGKYNLSSGVYFYRINAGGFTSTRKLIIMK